MDNLIKLKDAEDGCLATKEDWLPEYWEKRGFVRNWGDAAAMSPHFEVLRKQESGRVEFVILCPTFLRRPLIISTQDESAWGSY